ncbi:hypothetical protein TNCV_777821 [Trichonephila clavipes]|nr:hypothetical protein TNCV_777821 [Trichonephila clavipes]
MKEGRFVLGTFRSKRMRVLNRSRQNDRPRVMLVLVQIDITPPQIFSCDLMGAAPIYSLNGSFAKYHGRVSRVVKVLDRGWPYHEFESSTTEDLSCRGAMHVKSVESSNILPLMWCGN